MAQANRTTTASGMNRIVACVFTGGGGDDDDDAADDDGTDTDSGNGGATK